MPKLSKLSLDDILPFGKHEGEQLEDVIEDDPDYITWMYEEDNFGFDDEATRKLEEKKII